MPDVLFEIMLALFHRCPSMPRTRGRGMGRSGTISMSQDRRYTILYRFCCSQLDLRMLSEPALLGSQFWDHSTTRPLPPWCHLIPPSPLEWQRHNSQLNSPMVRLFSLVSFSSSRDSQGWIRTRVSLEIPASIIGGCQQGLYRNL
jgi:hypothetical protein